MNRRTLQAFVEIVRTLGAVCVVLCVATVAIADEDCVQSAQLVKRALELGEGAREDRAV